MSDPPLPHRPRLGDHVLARRYVADGVTHVVLHDTRTSRMIQLGTREWGLLAAADGTRDLEGIRLAAAREGAHARPRAIAAFFEQLSAASLLEDGGAEPDAATAATESPLRRDRPLAVLPDFSLHCDGRGSCCRIYASVIFGPVEAARARALRPSVLDGGARHERIFLPEKGSTQAGGSAVSLCEGRCAYLDDAGRCSLHALGGPSAKPLGCDLYPASFVDDGERVRVSVSVECACVLRSVGRPGGAPLILASARTRADLDEAVSVAELPADAPITRARRAPRRALVAFCDHLAAAAYPTDVASGLWSLGEAVDESGLELQAIGRFERPAALDPAAIRPWIEALARRAARREQEYASFRTAADLARRAAQWIAAAAGALAAPGALERLGSLPIEAPAGEAFYLRAIIHGHALIGELPLADALRDRAARLLLARAMKGMLGDLAPSDPAADEPLALVEAMLRGHGIDAYAYELSGEPAG